MSSRHRNLEPLGRWHATIYSLYLFYLHRLKADGVPVTHYHDTKGWHTMLTLTKGRFIVDAAVKAMENMVKFIETLPAPRHASVQTGP